MVAYEVACSLVAQGESVQLLALFDTVLPSAHRRGALGWLDRQRRAFIAGGPRALLSRGARKLRKVLTAANEVHAIRHIGSELATSAESQRLEARRQAEFGRVMREFEPDMRPYDGPIVLYRSLVADTYRSVVRGHGFGGFARGGWSECVVSGDHVTMMASGNVERIALDLVERLASTQVPAKQASNG